MTALLPSVKLQVADNKSVNGYPAVSRKKLLASTGSTQATPFLTQHRWPENKVFRRTDRAYALLTRSVLSEKTPPMEKFVYQFLQDVEKLAALKAKQPAQIELEALDKTLGEIEKLAPGNVYPVAKMAMRLIGWKPDSPASTPLARFLLDKVEGKPTTPFQTSEQLGLLKKQTGGISFGTVLKAALVALGMLTAGSYGALAVRTGGIAEANVTANAMIAKAQGVPPEMSPGMIHTLATSHSMIRFFDEWNLPFKAECFTCDNEEERYPIAVAAKDPNVSPENLRIILSSEAWPADAILYFIRNCMVTGRYGLLSELTTEGLISADQITPQNFATIEGEALQSSHPNATDFIESFRNTSSNPSRLQSANTGLGSW